MKGSFDMLRPKIKLPYSQPEKLLQVLSVVALLGLIILTVFSMINLPESIPTHFGADGRANEWGGKGVLLMLPIISVIFFVVVTILERFPWVYNYAVEITEKNAAYQYKLARLMLEWLKFILILIFLYIQWQFMQVAKGLSGGLGAWFLPVSMIAVFGLLGFFIYKMLKNK